MAKPATREGYKDEYTADCERVLVTLLRGLGPWKDSVFLVGGLTPRYLVPARPPAVPAHAGTLDVDVVIALQILTDTSRSGDLLAGGTGALRDTKRARLRPAQVARRCRGA